METEKIAKIVVRQRDYYKSGVTHDVNFRIKQLKILKKTINSHKEEILEALETDLNKPKLEGYVTEIEITLREIDHALKSIAKWAKKKKRRTSIINFPSSGYTLSSPYGLVLIISPWNYPFNLAMQPLVGAIAAGNCAVIKPSEYSAHTSAVIKKIIDECFSDDYIAVVEGEKQVNQALLKEKFDYIFFTGSTKVGQIVMEAASKHLTPVTLELGGKSPCIVCEDADIDVAAKRIVWGKATNSGQTCIAPDYLLVHKSKKKELLGKMKETIRDFYGDNPIESSDYGKIITEDHFDRLTGCLEGAEIIIGGRSDRETLKIEPTIVGDVSIEDDLMNEEIFGPILPVLEFDSIDEIFEIIDKNPTPLSLYLFTKSREIEKRITTSISFGGGCINDTIMHVSSHNMPFGGVGKSGMGSYHGKWSFETFSHQKNILKKATWLDIPLRYPPYANKLKWVEKIFK